METDGQSSGRIGPQGDEDMVEVGVKQTSFESPAGTLPEIIDCI